MESASAQRYEILKKFALQTMDRKEVKNIRDKARKDFAKARAEYDKASSQLDDLQRKIDQAQQDMAEARQIILDMSQYMQRMDVTDANAVRFRPETDTYIIDNKEYVVDDSDVNDIKTTPYKEYKKQDKEDECEDDDAEVEKYLLQYINPVVEDYAAAKEIMDYDE